MLSIIQIRGDGTYYTSIGGRLFAQWRRTRGLWLGEGAQALGLSGLVEDAVYRRLLGGFSPLETRNWFAMRAQRVGGPDGI